MLYLIIVWYLTLKYSGRESSVHNTYRTSHLEERSLISLDSGFSFWEYFKRIFLSIMRCIPSICGLYLLVWLAATVETANCTNLQMECFHKWSAPKYGTFSDYENYSWATTATSLQCSWFCHSLDRKKWLLRGKCLHTWFRPIMERTGYWMSKCAFS